MGVYLALFLIMWKYAPKDNMDDNNEELIEETIHLNEHNNDFVTSNQNYHTSSSSPSLVTSERSRSTTRSVDEIRLRASFG
jgi:hypothetical protein